MSSLFTWQVSQQDFLGTQNNPALSVFYTDIATRFGIDWTRVQWQDLRKPLYSGLAAALYMVSRYGTNIPIGVERQAAWYQKLFFPNDPMAAYNFTKLATQLDTGGCGVLNSPFRH